MATTFARLKQAFVDFAQHLPFYGIAVLCVDDAHVREIMPLMTKPDRTYGSGEDAQVRARVVTPSGGMPHCFAASAQDDSPLAGRLNLAGRHNVHNALAAIAVSGLDRAPEEPRSRRRSPNSRAWAAASSATAKSPAERAGQPGGSSALIDDYGHHPAEMAATSRPRAARFPAPAGAGLPAAPLYPHPRLFEDFVKVLSTCRCAGADGSLPAGETPIVAADGRALARAVRVAGKVEPVFVETWPMCRRFRAVAQDGDSC